MKLLRFEQDGRLRPGLLDDVGKIRDLSSHVRDIEGTMLSDADLARLRALDTDALPVIEGNPRIGPCVGNVGKFMCIGLNYSDHAAESGMDIPQHPILFLKANSAISGPNDEILLPRGSTATDWEAELGVVIGSRVRRATADQAAAAIAGYTVVNDISVRDFQRHTAQFMPGKAWENTTPVGPYLVTAEREGPPSFPISCEVDGQVMQSSNTTELCFGPIALVRYISTFTTLVPGDLIVTGTPGGVGVARDPQVFLRRGQTVVTRIDGVGTCRNVCV